MRKPIRNTLVGIALVGTAMTTDCYKFNNTKMIERPYDEKVVWNSYLQEDIPHNTSLWKAYQNIVARRNRITDFTKLNRETILLPDLDEVD
jgi:hypothetical protein